MDSTALRKIAKDYELAAKLLREAADMQDRFMKKFPGMSALDIPIQEANLSVRCRQLLQQFGIERIGQLVEKTEVDLLKGTKLGPLAVKEIKRELTRLGLELRT